MIYTKSHKCSKKKTTNTVQIQKQQVATLVFLIDDGYCSSRKKKSIKILSY